jgi:putative salt-induced outer membrane protein
MNIRLRGLLALASFLIPALGFADTITLKNGDRITGSVVKTDGPDLIFKGEQAGDMKVPLDNITQLTTTAPINVTTKDGQLLVGPTSLDTTKAAVQTVANGTVQADRANVTAIRSMDEQKAYQAEIDRYAHPGPLDLWAGTFDFGLGLSSGNSQTTSYNTAFNAVRATKRDKLSVYFTSLYNKQEIYTVFNPNNPVLGGRYVSTTSANARRGGLAYSIDFSKKWFGWASFDLENNDIQQLNLRLNPAGGLGYHVFKNDSGFLDLLAGGSYNREYFAFQNPQSYGEFVVGDEFEHIFSKRSHLHESFRFFPNLTDTGQYRINLDITAATALTKLLSLQVSLSDRYLSNPPLAIFPSAPIKNNDLIFSTGIRLTFAR